MNFSIIIPSYNRVDYLKLAIESILNQQFSDFEIIVVDDGSTDNTENMVRSFYHPSIQYYKIKNSERGAARNFGLSKSSGRYINYFDSDDLYLPCFSSLTNFINTNKQPAVVYGEIKNLRENGEVIVSKPLPYSSFTKNLLHNNFLACGSVFLRRDVAVEFLFHEKRRLSSAEDWELWIRVHTKYEFTYFPEAVFQQVFHSGRSLAAIDPQRVEDRDTYFAELVLRNDELKSYYGKESIDLFIADRLTFMALTWSGISLTKAFFYWREAFLTSWRIVTRKRFWAILKKLIFNL